MQIRPGAAVKFLRQLGQITKPLSEDIPAQIILSSTADLIERQAAQIERMRAALVEARRMACESSESFKEHIALLRMIDEAMGEQA